MSGTEGVAIVGGGPAGSTLAALLARKGKSVVLFAGPRRRTLVVGESLVPAVVPILARLGVEEEVAEISTYKPGATVTFSEADRYPLPFVDAEGTLPPYSYNTPRADFDRILLDAARRAGAHVVEEVARIERTGPDSIALADAARRAARPVLGGAAPDLIVDATGRARLVSRRLELPAIAGPRKDTALFAHYESAVLDRPGHIHVDRNARGWGWRIPLPGRVSVGVVVERRHLRGDTREEQLDHMVKTDSALRAITPTRRLTDVARYDNYQLRSARLVGDGWVLVGDAAGFADPIFSTGTYLAMRGAEMLADALSVGASSALSNYEGEWLAELCAWQRIIGLWYDGRLFSLLRLGRFMRRLPPARPVDGHIGRHMTRIFTGEAGRNGYGQALLSVVAPAGRAGARSLAIR
jgi:flavin-dependent dehydrogenase